MPKCDLKNELIGSYVVVRCRDAGVHAGVLAQWNGREAILEESRRLWYWKPLSGKFLSAVANNGLDRKSRVGEPVKLLVLSEFCEILKCSKIAEQSIREIASDV